MQATRSTPFTVVQQDDFEPQRGLPECLPAGERLVWQGAPGAWQVFRHVFHGWWVALYFAVLLAWQVAATVGDGVAWSTALGQAARIAPLYALALALLALLARLAAGTTVYTLTSRRVVMRIGIVLTVTYNLPLRCIDAAHLHPLARGHGDIALALHPATRIAWLHLWPHVRPWRVKHSQPTMRCVPDAHAVAEQLLSAWALANVGSRGLAPAAQGGAEPAAAGAAVASSPAAPSTSAPSVSAPRAHPVAAAVATAALALPAFVAAHLPGGMLGWPQG
jgi:hypothetical protein